ncbi:hypothetical protein Q5C_04000 [Leuconostoc pseudomesenteroides 4882]|nr:hypothetical protein Q5C_04000 [Leuconostoc pseudomesenteroides 4882]
MYLNVALILALIIKIVQTRIHNLRLNVLNVVKLSNVSSVTLYF